MKKYWNPTPRWARKLGDSLLGVSTLLATYSIVESWGKYITIAMIAFGVIGKFLTNFFSEDPQ